ncbi:arginyl-tRNA synthetase [Angomonas deanei]|uniref:arginine--tRNA ligase n=1 Tax=Angomonas deanei TaxID=59799 RepID=S9VEM2_9TRYP|nr:arginyl-tRNA synthetase [Angomonas deanei]EPY41167.1 arginyl-tRNA synthetase [Angomonas deanei]CAD2217384.1 Arginyl tRNA synthetase N terminal domain/tRNA synthetases class I (R)/DALR anticodon binding domain containing protein, putative [Angomonas deanei]|eukprot:EPY37935.1 arginyl-tRNA synthetase [Angomonas deanei]
MSVVSNIDLLLREIVSKAMVTAFPALDPIPEPLITLGRMSEYQCNNAMALTKQLSQLKPPLKMSPEQIGNKLKESLPENEIIEEFVPTAKGFIDISIRKEWTAKTVNAVVKEGIVPPPLPMKRVLVDFSSPNIAKEMHVGHLRSTIIGECICRLLEFCQYDVARINHVGDWGTAFGMLILYIKRNFPDFEANPPDISDLTGFYRAAKQCFDEDEEFKESARLEVVKLQSLEEDSIRVWKFICDVSRNEFNKIYTRLGVTIEERGESFYNPLIPEVLQKLEEAGQIEESDGAKLIISKESKKINALDARDMTKLAGQHLVENKRSGNVYHPNLIAAMKKQGILTGEEGAEVVQLSKKESKPWAKFDLRMDLDKLMSMLAPLYNKGVDPLFLDVFTEAGIVDGDNISVPRFSFPLMVLKSDGGYTYDTTDMAAMYHRFVLEKLTRVIYCTDLGQFEHFNMCAQAAKDVHWMDNATWDHAGFGLVTGTDGKKIKTRSGESAKLKDLLDEACERSLAILKEREESDRAQGHSAEEMTKLSEVIGIGAVKYFDLKQTRTSDYAFNYDKMLDLSGNTAVFLLYQYARICSIKRKAGVSDEEIASFEVTLNTPQEKKLALCAFRFHAVILKTVEDLFPHHLTDFAYELVSAFSDFFQNCKVVGDPDQNSRLCLIELTRMTLKKTLDILNIEVTEKI